MTVDVGAEENRTQWAHEEARTEGRQGEHQRGKGAIAWKEGFGNGRGVKAKDHEVEHL